MASAAAKHATNLRSVGERLQFPEADVGDQDAEQHEHGPDEAPDERIVASIARAIRARGRGLDADPEQPEGGAVGDEHEIADHARRQPRREAALRRGGETQPMGVLEDHRASQSGRRDQRGHLQSRRFPTGGAPTVRQFLVVVFLLIRSCPHVQEPRFSDGQGARVGPDRLKLRWARTSFGPNGDAAPERASYNGCVRGTRSNLQLAGHTSSEALRIRRSAPWQTSSPKAVRITPAPAMISTTSAHRTAQLCALQHYAHLRSSEIRNNSVSSTPPRQLSPQPVSSLSAISIKCQ